MDIASLNIRLSKTRQGKLLKLVQDEEATFGCKRHEILGVSPVTIKAETRIARFCNEQIAELFFDAFLFCKKHQLEFEKWRQDK